MKNIFFNNRIKLVLRSSETGKKIETIKFSKEETIQIRQTAALLKMTEKELFDEAFDYILKVAVNRVYFKKPI